MYILIFYINYRVKYYIIVLVKGLISVLLGIVSVIIQFNWFLNWYLIIDLLWILPLFFTSQLIIIIFIMLLGKYGSISYYSAMFLAGITAYWIISIRNNFFLRVGIIFAVDIVLFIFSKLIYKSIFFRRTL